MTLADLVRREARRRGAAGAAAVRAFPDEAWREAEGRILAATYEGPRRARALVAAFERSAARHGGAEPRGRAARLRGSWLAYVGRNAEAVPCYRDAARRLRGDARSGALLGLAGAQLRLGRYRDALRICESLRAEAIAAKRPQLLALAAQNAGVALQESGDLAGAEERYRQALVAIAAAAADPPATASVLQRAAVEDNLANVLASLDRFEEAESLQRSALLAFDAAGATNEAARCRGNLGALLAWTDRLGEADALLREAETAFRRAGDPLHAALARRDRGETLLRAGLVPEARHALRSSGRTLRGAAPPIEVARTAFAAARAALASDEPAAALRAIRTAPVAVRDRAESLEIEGRAVAVAGDVALGRRKLLSAARAFGRARPAGRARSLAAAAWCAEAAGDVASARRLAAVAERVARPLPVPGLRFAAAAARFLAETAGTPRRAPADAALARAVDALEAHRRGLGPDAMRAALLRGREAWVARAVRHLLAGPDGARRALTFLERWRARSLMDLLAEATASDGAERGVSPTPRAESLRRVVAALEHRAEGRPAPGFLRTTAGAVSSGAVGGPANGRSDAGPVSPSLLRRLRAAERDLLDTLRRDGAAAARPFSDEDFEAVRAALPADVLVAAPVEDGDRVVVLVVSREGVRAVPSPATAADVRAAASSLLWSLGAWTLGDAYVARHEARLRRSVDGSLARLAGAFVAPLDDAIGDAARLVVVPSGPWHHVPVAALPWRGRPLVERLPVTFVPALAALRDPVPAPRGASVVVAAPDESAPATGAEGAAVASALGAALQTGSEATSSALDACAEPACLHIAAHGRHRPDAPGASGVRLADGWFRAAEFAHLRLRGSLVVLSGCETGVAAVGAGDEAMGLVRAAFAAGAADVVASLWRIDDRATAAFMTDFHRRRAGPGADGGREEGALGAGAGNSVGAAGGTRVDPARALAAAQRALAAEGAPPWRWAGFVHHARRV